MSLLMGVHPSPIPGPGWDADCKVLAERLGAPVVNSYLHNDSFPASHNLWCGPLGYQGSKAAMKLMATQH